MTKTQARRLLLYTVVFSADDRGDTGTVTQKGRTGVFIVWKNGQKGWIAYQDMQLVSVF